MRRLFFCAVSIIAFLFILLILSCSNSKDSVGPASLNVEPIDLLNPPDSGGGTLSDSITVDTLGWDSLPGDTLSWNTLPWDTLLWDTLPWDTLPWDTLPWDTLNWDTIGWDTIPWDTVGYDTIIQDT